MLQSHGCAHLHVVPGLGTCYTRGVQIIARRTLRLFWDDHPQAETPLRTWYALVLQAKWAGTADVKATFGTADFAADNRIIFDIGGNKFRLIVHVFYSYSRVLVKFIGTHAEYDRINQEKI